MAFFCRIWYTGAILVFLLFGGNWDDGYDFADSNL